MAATARDRVTIDLRGIGDAVRATAATRAMTVAELGREALLGACDDFDIDALPQPACDDRAQPRCKLTLRLTPFDAGRLVFNARRLGLSYGSYVGHLVRGTPLPMPHAERQADRAALRASTDQIAELAVSLRDLIRLLRMADKDGAIAYGSVLARMEGDVARHLERASAFIADH
jgi:hypothetical protein